MLLTKVEASLSRPQPRPKEGHSPFPAPPEGASLKRPPSSTLGLRPCLATRPPALRGHAPSLPPWTPGPLYTLPSADPPHRHKHLARPSSAPPPLSATWGSPSGLHLAPEQQGVLGRAGLPVVLGFYLDHLDLRGHHGESEGLRQATTVAPSKSKVLMLLTPYPHPPYTPPELVRGFQPQAPLLCLRGWGWGWGRPSTYTEDSPLPITLLQRPPSKRKASPGFRPANTPGA